MRFGLYSEKAIVIICYNQGQFNLLTFITAVMRREITLKHILPPDCYNTLDNRHPFALSYINMRNPNRKLILFRLVPFYVSGENNNIFQLRLFVG